MNSWSQVKPLDTPREKMKKHMMFHGSGKDILPWSWKSISRLIIQTQGRRIKYLNTAKTKFFVPIGSNFS